MTAPGLQFEYKSISEEVRSFAEVASQFLEPDGLLLLLQAVRDLEQISQRNTTAMVHWQTPDAVTIRTKVSKGSYQPNDNGALHLRGQASFIWGIQNATDEIKKKSTAYKRFDLVGIATTTVELLAVNDDEETRIALWNFDVGDHASPGCHFHVQIPEDRLQPYFPVDVPRWPSLIYTPTDAIDFLLGEMFQKAWATAASQTRPAAQRWQTLQRRRLQKTLTWIRERIADSLGPAWTQFKVAKPPRTMLVE